MKAAVITSAVALCFVGGPVASEPINDQGGRSTPTTGYINPAAPTYNSNAPMRCTASTNPSTSFMNQNRAALQQAVSDASTTGKWIWIQPCVVDAANSNTPCPVGDSCGYPVNKRTSGLTQCGIDFTNLSGITIIGDQGSLIRMAGDTSLHDYYLLCITKSSHVKLLGLTFSQRDVINASEQTHIVEMGLAQGSASTTDDIEIRGNRIIEGQGGDAFRILGSPTETVTRVSITDNVVNGARSGVSFQRGHLGTNIIGNAFFGVKGQDIDNEPTSAGVEAYTLAEGNFSDRSSSSSAGNISFSGFNVTQNTFIWFTDNISIAQCYTGGINVAQLWYSGNQCLTTLVALDGSGNPGSSAPNLDLFRRNQDEWITDNTFVHGPLVNNDQTIIQINAEDNNCDDSSTVCEPQDIWIVGNRLDQYSVTTPEAAIFFDSVHDFWIERNDIIWHGAQADAGTNSGFQGVHLDSTSVIGHPSTSGYVVGNRVHKGLQADGVTPAGRMMTGLRLNSTGSGTIGRMTFRDNSVDGARALNIDDYTLSTLTNDVPLQSGNILTNGVNFIEDSGATTGWRTDTTPKADSLSTSGTLLAATTQTFILAADCGSDSFTLPNGVYDGQIRDIEVHATCTTAGALALTMGDGSSISWLVTNVAPTAFVQLAWDATGSEWWVTNKNNVTVNP